MIEKQQHPLFESYDSVPVFTEVRRRKLNTYQLSITSTHENYFLQVLATLRYLSKGDYQSEAPDIHPDNITFPMEQEEIL